MGTKKMTKKELEKKAAAFGRMLRKWDAHRDSCDVCGDWKRLTAYCPVGRRLADRVLPVSK